MANTINMNALPLGGDDIARAMESVRQEQARVQNEATQGDSLTNLASEASSSFQDNNPYTIPTTAVQDRFGQAVENTYQAPVPQAVDRVYFPSRAASAQEAIQASAPKQDGKQAGPKLTPEQIAYNLNRALETDYQSKLDKANEAQRMKEQRLVEKGMVSDATARTHAAANGVSGPSLDALQKVVKYYNGDRSAVPSRRELELAIKATERKRAGMKPGEGNITASTQALDNINFQLKSTMETKVNEAVDLIKEEIDSGKIPKTETEWQKMVDAKTDPMLAPYVRDAAAKLKPEDIALNESVFQANAGIARRDLTRMGKTEDEINKIISQPDKHKATWEALDSKRIDGWYRNVGGRPVEDKHSAEQIRAEAASEQMRIDSINKGLTADYVAQNSDSEMLKKYGGLSDSAANFLEFAESFDASNLYDGSLSSKQDSVSAAGTSAIANAVKIAEKHLSKEAGDAAMYNAISSALDAAIANGDIIATSQEDRAAYGKEIFDRLHKKFTDERQSAVQKNSEAVRGVIDPIKDSLVDRTENGTIKGLSDRFSVLKDNGSMESIWKGLGGVPSEEVINAATRQLVMQYSGVSPQSVAGQYLDMVMSSGGAGMAGKREIERAFTETKAALVSAGFRVNSSNLLLQEQARKTESLRKHNLGMFVNSNLHAVSQTNIDMNKATVEYGEDNKPKTVYRDARTQGIVAGLQRSADREIISSMLGEMVIGDVRFVGTGASDNARNALIASNVMQGRDTDMVQQGFVPSKILAGVDLEVQDNFAGRKLDDGKPMPAPKLSDKAATLFKELRGDKNPNALKFYHAAVNLNNYDADTAALNIDRAYKYMKAAFAVAYNDIQRTDINAVNTSITDDKTGAVTIINLIEGAIGSRFSNEMVGFGEGPEARLDQAIYELTQRPDFIQDFSWDHKKQIKLLIGSALTKLGTVEKRASEEKNAITLDATTKELVDRRKAQLTNLEKLFGATVPFGKSDIWYSGPRV